MLELFIEMTDHVFWEGYAEELSRENPAVFRARLKQFIESYEQNPASPHHTQSYFIRIIQKNYSQDKMSTAGMQG